MAPIETILDGTALREQSGERQHSGRNGYRKSSAGDHASLVALRWLSLRSCHADSIHSHSTIARIGAD